MHQQLDLFSLYLKVWFIFISWASIVASAIHYYSREKQKYQHTTANPILGWIDRDVDYM